MSAILDFFRQLLCRHRARTTRPMIMHPEGSTFYLCRCDTCGATWMEHG